ncbi:MAG TPA: hypothetical protein VGX91_10010 [Candidatus Cybelea sp.]|nr:hypothetical protein [Candidatus Cybelea sp.]
MKSLENVFAAALLPLVFALPATPALAVTSYGTSEPVPYVAAFSPATGFSGSPHAGTMRLLISNGMIHGTYSGISVMPDRFNDRIVPVDGTIAPDGYVQLHVDGALSFSGSMDGNGILSGTATYLGRIYEFMAKPGEPGRALESGPTTR